MPTGSSVDAWRGVKYRRQTSGICIALGNATIFHGGNKSTYVLNRSDVSHSLWPWRSFTKIGCCVVASNSRFDELDVLPAPPSLHTNKQRCHSPQDLSPDHNTTHPRAQFHHDNLFFDILQALTAGQFDTLALVSQHQTCSITSAPTYQPTPLLLAR